MKRHPELATISSVFNLVGQSAADPWRVERESWAAAERKREAAEYSARMQRMLSQCPGFESCDAPNNPMARGKVVVQAGRVADAMPWLKRRLHVAENLELSSGDGLVIEIQPRIRRSPTGGKRIKVSFDKPVQFELAI